MADDYGSILLMVGGNTDWPGAPHLQCGDGGNSETFNYDLVPRIININIDGTSYKGSTDGAECSLGGKWCTTNDTQESIYEECEALDIICHTRNVWKFLSSTFLAWFIPTPGALTAVFSDMLAFLRDKFGMLYQAMDFIIQYLQIQISVDQSCTLTFQHQLFGKNLPQFNACWMEQNMPLFWTAISTFARAAIAAAMVFAIYRKFLHTWDEVVS